MCAGKTTKTRNNKFVTVVTASTMQYLTQHPEQKGTQKEGVCASHVCRWSIAAGKRPVPFRTRKLSLHTLMVLQPGGCGRVSHRRHQTTKQQNSVYDSPRKTITPNNCGWLVLLGINCGFTPASVADVYSVEQGLCVVGCVGFTPGVFSGG